MIRSIKHCIATAVVMMLFCALGNSQERVGHDLVLTGTVVGVSVIPAPGSFKKSEKAFEIELYLQFINNTDGPLIIPTPSELDGFINVRFQDELFAPAGSGVSAKIVPQYYARVIRDFRGDRSIPLVKGYRRYGSIEEPLSEIQIDHLMSDLGAGRPKTSGFAVIQPHGYFECVDKIIVTDGFRVETIAGGRSKVVEAAVPKYPALRIQYLLSTSIHKDMADTLLDAKQKWMDIGTLFLNSSGNYDVTSDVILNKLKD